MIKKIFVVLISLTFGINAFCADSYETNIKGNKITIGTIKDVKGEFEPSLKMTKWNNEEYLKFTFKGDKKFKTDKKTIDNKIKVSNDDMVIEYYTQGDNMKAVIEFKKKPKTNTYSFILESWEDFNFYYQPELTQEEIDMGAERPDNVVGSYEVFHKTKRDHIVGQTNYGIGKAWHIYRPKIIDALGATAWVDLNITNGIYTGTVPPLFWNSATYPIKINDTFGDMGIGGSSYNIDFAFGRFDAPADGTVTSISFYVQNTAGGTQYLELGYYTWKLSTWYIDNHVAHSASTSVADGFNNWKTANVSGSITNGETYWIGAQLATSAWGKMYYTNKFADNLGYSNSWGGSRLVK